MPSWASGRSSSRSAGSQTAPSAFAATTPGSRSPTRPSLSLYPAAARAGALRVWAPGGGLAGGSGGVGVGAPRTGAVDAGAADGLALPDAYVVGVAGSGRQGWTQLWAATAARRIAEVRVFSPTASHRDR